MKIKLKFNCEPKEFDKSSVGMAEKEIYQVNYSCEHMNSPSPNYDLMMTLLFVQGFLNRKEPSFYMDFESYFGKVDYFGDEAPKNSAEFRRYYGQTRGYNFLPIENSESEALKKFAPCFNGLIIYNEKNIDNGVVALNLASINDCLPISAANYCKYESAFIGCKVLEYIDFSSYERAEVYEYILSMSSQFNLKGAYSLGYEYETADGSKHIRYHIMGLDYCVKQKNLIFLLSANERNRGSCDYMVLGSPKQYEIMECVLSKLTAPAALMGWCDPEWRWALSATRFGHFVYCTDWANNLSFHAVVKPLKKFPYAQKCIPKKGKPQNKAYIAILANEGDTPKMVSQLYNNGWLNPRRGDYKANWAFNPSHSVHFPALVEYYYETATPNDYFTLAPNGAGYNNVRENTKLDSFLKETARVNENLNLAEADLWYANYDQIAEYFEKMPQINGLSIEPHLEKADGECFSVAGKPVLRHIDRLYYWYNKRDLCSNCVIDEEKLMNYLLELYGDGSKPVFIPIYGYESKLIENFAKFADKLDKTKFEIVDYGTLMNYVGEVAKPKKNNYVAPKAACLWNSSSIKNQALWYSFDGTSEFEVTKEGLKVTIGANAEVKKSGFRSDILSSTLLDGQTSAMVAVKGVVIPAGAKELIVSTSEMSKGCNWMFWAYGDYDGFGLRDKWEPFWKPLWKGERSEEIPTRIKNYCPKASDYIILCVEGKPGDYCIFDKLEFI